MTLQTSRLSKTFGAVTVFEDLNFKIGEKDRIALIGENGSGKSTLLRLLAGIDKPDAGTIAVTQGARVALMEQEPRLDEAATVLESALDAKPELRSLADRLKKLEDKLATEFESGDYDKILSRYGKAQEEFQAAGGYEHEHRVKSILQGLGFSEATFEQPASQLSGGEKKYLALAQALASEANILLLDEPDNHLDIPAKQWLQQYIREYSGAVLIISHDRYFLDAFVDHLFELEDGHLYEYHCNYSAFREQKQERLEKQAALYAQRKRELAELKKSAEQLTQWAKLNNKFAGRARNRRRMLEKQRTELESQTRPIVDRNTIDVEFRREERSGSMALEVQGLAMSFGERTLFSDVSFTLPFGARVGLVGPNGSGKTTLFRILLGEAEPSSGSVRFGSRVNLGYYSQEHETLDERASPLETLKTVKPMPDDRAIAFLRGKLLFRLQDCEGPVASLSGGQKSRLQLACLAMQGVNFLLLDEPTNNLDIPSMIQLEAALLDFDATILTISHDRYFLDTITDTTLAISDGHLERYPGSFTYFFEKTGGAIDLGRLTF